MFGRPHIIDYHHTFGNISMAQTPSVGANARLEWRDNRYWVLVNPNTGQVDGDGLRVLAEMERETQQWRNNGHQRSTSLFQPPTVLNSEADYMHMMSIIPAYRQRLGLMPGEQTHNLIQYDNTPPHHRHHHHHTNTHHSNAQSICCLFVLFVCGFVKSTSTETVS